MCVTGTRRKRARWQAPSLNRSLISTPGPTEAIKLDLSDGTGDQRADVLRTEKEKKLNSRKGRKIPPGQGLLAPLRWELELQRSSPVTREEE